MNIDFDDSENVVNPTVSLSVAMLLMWARLSLRGHIFVFAQIRLFVMLAAVGEEVTVGGHPIVCTTFAITFSTLCANSELIRQSIFCCKILFILLNANGGTVAVSQRL